MTLELLKIQFLNQGEHPEAVYLILNPSWIILQYLSEVVEEQENVYFYICLACLAYKNMMHPLPELVPELSLNWWRKLSIQSSLWFV